MKHLITIALCCIFVQVQAQYVRVSGFVRDAHTKEALVGACITDNTTGAVSFSNASGFYSMRVAANANIDISFAYLAYKAYRYQAAFADSVLQQVFLYPNEHILETVEVSAHTMQREKTEISTISMPISQIKELPSITGETDILRSFQLMPGVQGGKEATSGIYVRGGSPDQNLFLLDGLELYNVNHIGGFLSTFDPNAINSVKLYKGGFPARYGGRLSSVVDLTMKDGNKKDWQGEFFMGTLASKLSIEGPIHPDTTSIFVSLRRCNVDIFTRPLVLLETELTTMAGYTFYDFYAKYNTILSKKGRFSLSIYNGRDKVFASYRDKAKNETETSVKAKDNIKWGNTAVAARYTHLFSPKVFGSFMASYVSYRYKRTLDVRESDYGSAIEDKSYYGLLSGVRDVSFRSDIDIYLSPAHTLTSGIRLVGHKFKPGNTKYEGFFSHYSAKGTPHIYAFDGDLYLQDDWEITPRLSLNMGLRGNIYHVRQHSFTSLQPRINAYFRFYKDYAFKASYTEMHQPIHLVSSHNAALPSDVWLPATNLLPPETAQQYTLGLFKDIDYQGHSIEVSLEGYYKRLNHLIDYQEGVSFFSNSGQWEERAEPQGVADIYGIEFLMQKQTGRTTGLLSYTWSKNTRQFDNINHGLPYPYHYDRRHDISVVLTHHFTKNITLSATWVYNTGVAITLAKAHYINPVEEGYYGKPAETHVYGGKNSYRVPAFHKLDISASFSKQKAKGIRVWTVGLYNAYAHQNAFYLFYKREKDGKLALYQYTLFPFLPSVSYSFRF